MSHQQNSTKRSGSIEKSWRRFNRYQIVRWDAGFDLSSHESTRRFNRVQFAVECKAIHKANSERGI